MERLTGMHLSDCMESVNLKKCGNKICIVSGVGSGKNFWVENGLTKQGSVLLITSRRIKVDETIAKTQFISDLNSPITRPCVACTNAAIENYLKKSENPLHNGFIDSFSYIVVDEAHSIVSDSTFTTSSFNLWTFVKCVCLYKPVILMTGTIYPIRKILENNQWKIIDFSDKCVNIKPKNVIVTTKELALKEIIAKKNTNIKMIYLANSAHDIVKNIYPLLTTHFNPQNISMIMSDRYTNELLDDDQKRISTQTYNLIVTKNVLPDETRILLATSRLKEGININDKRVIAAFCESHSYVDIVQFAGRIRCQVEELFVIEDSQPFRKNYYNDIEIEYCMKSECKSANNYLNQILNTSKYGHGFSSYYITNPDVKKFVDFEENKFQLIKYNYLLNRFEFNELPIIANTQCSADESDFAMDAYDYLKINEFGLHTYEEYDCKTSQEKIIEYFKENDLIDVILNKCDEEKILSDFKNMCILNKDKRPYSNLGSILNIGHLVKLNVGGHKKTGANYGKFKIEIVG